MSATGIKQVEAGRLILKRIESALLLWLSVIASQIDQPHLTLKADGKEDAKGNVPRLA